MIRRIATALTVAALAGASLTACGAGNEPQTAKSKGSVQGTNLDHGSVAIRAASIITDGTDAYVSMTLVNNGDSTDTLEAVSTSASPKALILDADSKETTVALESKKAVAFTNSGTTIDLAEIASAPQVGSLVTLSLSFKLAGDVSLQIPVVDYKDLTGGSEE